MRCRIQCAILRWPVARRIGVRWLSIHRPGRPLQQPTIQKLRDERHWLQRRNDLSTSAIGRYEESTIYALSTAPGKAAIAIIRISGPACLDIYSSLCPNRPALIPRQAAVRTLYSPDSLPNESTILDRNALLLYFAAPRTVTGEDILELHVHGGPAIIQAVLRAIAKCTTSARQVAYAEPGEFTRRAFYNGKLDLTQVEALGDSLAAATEQQRRLSIRGSAGLLSKRYEAWRMQLLNARGELEALIDFSEDQHFDESVPELLASVAAQVEGLLQPLRAHVTNAMRGELLRSGIQISLLGAPNAGKSSLLNRIVGREAAIVSHEAGTTRDVVEVGIDIGGYFCRLGDTAGLRSTEAHRQRAQQGGIGAIEQEGMRRAKERASSSDVVVVVIDFEITDGDIKLRLDPEVFQTAAQLHADGGNIVVVLNKVDLVADAEQLDAAFVDVMRAVPGLNREHIFPLSCYNSTTSDNIQDFLAGLAAFFQTMTTAIAAEANENDADPSIWQESLGATMRHRLLLEQTIEALERFAAIAQPLPPDSPSAHVEYADADVVVAAEHLRDAADGLAKITGRGEAGDVEEVLGVVFEKFCVGK